jgi:glucose-1-phosphate thymidylyltransferase
MPTEHAIVLARGLGSRMRAEDPSASLTESQRKAADAGLKAMMPIGTRPFLDYVLSALGDAGIRNVALVVAPEHEMIRKHYGENAVPSRTRLTLVVQHDAKGTANAMLAAEEWCGDDPFLTVNSDNLYPPEVLRALVAIHEPALPAFRRAQLVRSSNIRDEQVRSFAILEVDPDGYLRRIVEKPPADVIARAGEAALLSMNCWRFDRRIFQPCRDIPLSSRGEYELPQAVMLAIERGVRFRTIPSNGPVLDLSRRADAAEVSRRLSHITPNP